MSDITTMTISYPLPLADPGVDDFRENPLARSLVPLTEMHKQLPKLRVGFLSYENGPPERWLGMFVRSDGKRILFFPGFDAEMPRVRSSNSGLVRCDRLFAFDHVSLDENRKDWHITSARSKDHIGGGQTLDLGDGRVLWLVLVTPGIDLFRRAKQKTTAEFVVSDKAIKYKCNQIAKAIEGGESVNVPLPKVGNGDALPMISIIVGPKDFIRYDGPWFPPFACSHITGLPEPNVLTTVKRISTQFPLDDTTDIQVSTMWLPGQMAIPLAMYTPKPISPLS